MNDKPILFSAPMVRAILAGTKTQTRRVIKCPPHYQIEEKDDGKPWPWMYDSERDRDHFMPCPHGEPGTRLWVRETWAIVPRTAYRCSEGVQQTLRPDDDHDAAIYRAGWDRSNGGFRWRPSIHMPRWASRITLEVTGIRVERLQDISEADARAEGVEDTAPPGAQFVNDSVRTWRDYTDQQRLVCLTAKVSYRTLWESINGPGSWKVNPYVWAVEFRRVTP